MKEFAISALRPTPTPAAVMAWLKRPNVQEARSRIVLRSAPLTAEGFSGFKHGENPMSDQQEPFRQRIVGHECRCVFRRVYRVFYTGGATPPRGAASWCWRPCGGTSSSWCRPWPGDASGKLDMADDAVRTIPGNVTVIPRFLRPLVPVGAKHHRFGFTALWGS